MLSSLQILRGLAAWLVVGHHVAKIYFADSSTNPVLGFFSIRGDFGVDVFFVLSGVVMATVASSYTRAVASFWWNRFFRVVPVYWFYTSLAVVTPFLLPGEASGNWWTPASLAKSIAFIPHANPNGTGIYPTLLVGWTLIYEMFFYSVFALVLASRIPKPEISCAAILVAVALIFRRSEFLGASSMLLIHFAVGIGIVIVARVLDRRPTRYAGILRWVPLFGLAGLAFVFASLDRLIVAHSALAGLVVYAVVSCERLLSKGGPMVGFLKALGDISYSTYLSHLLVIVWFTKLIPRTESAVASGLVVTGICLVTYGISRLSFRHLERNHWVLVAKTWTIARSTSKLRTHAESGEPMPRRSSP